MSIPYIHDEVVHNPEAAHQVLPVLFDIYRPNSILDVGCGLGNWIQVAKTMGVNEVAGVDGAYVNRSLLKIDDSEFIEKDLTKPFELGRRFDLVICLEVAEHLPESSARGLIQSIAQHADVVMFSAAIPGQGGQNHINEQWPEYWQQLFDANGFDMFDYFRPKIWNNQKIERWYRQNLLLAVKKHHPLANSLNKNILSLVHPELLNALMQQHQEKIKELKSQLDSLRKRDLLGKLSRFIHLK